MKKVKNDQHMRECVLHIQTLSAPGSVICLKKITLHLSIDLITQCLLFDNG